MGGGSHVPVLVLLAAACLLVGCAGHVNRTARDTGTDSASGLPALPDEAAGWQADGAPQHYVEDDLYLYINGGAVTWIECGFRRVVAREYTNHDKGRLILEIYEMSSPEAARCIYQRRAGANGTPLELGDGGRLYDYYLEFRHGRFLVTLTSMSADNGPPPGMTDLASAAEGLLAP